MEQEISNRNHALIYTVMGILLVIASVTAVYQFRKSRQYRMELNNQYTRAFYELSDYVNDIETNLNKGMLASSPAQLASISGEIYRLSNSAKSCLGELPTSQVQLDKTAKFLSQTGDYTYVLSRNSINGEKITDKQYDEIKSLTDYASELNKSLGKIRDGIADGSISFVRKNGKNSVQAASDILSDLENVEESFSDYPSLIYDGPFSEHIENRESPILKNANEITVDEARQKAASFFGTDIASVIFESDTQNSSIDAYNFYIERETRSNISITKKGGYVLYYLKDREIEKEKIDFDDAIEIGLKYLKDNGYESMVSSYYDKAGGIATVNYAYVQDGITCYSDLIKVKVALDNGEVLGFETNGYLMNHSDRKIKKPELSEDEAENKVSSHLDVEESDLALIPKDSLEEVLCYEFTGSFGDRNFIIYINAENGREERILMLIESEEGILTV